MHRGKSHCEHRPDALPLSPQKGQCAPDFTLILLYLKAQDLGTKQERDRGVVAETGSHPGQYSIAKLLFSDKNVLRLWPFQHCLDSDNFQIT